MKETSFPFTFSSQEEKDRLIGVMDNLLEMVDSMTLHNITADITEILDGVNDKILMANGVLQGETEKVAKDIPAFIGAVTAYPVKEPAASPEEQALPPEEVEEDGERRIVTILHLWQKRKQQVDEPQEVEPEEGERRIVTLLRHFNPYPPPEQPPEEVVEEAQAEVKTNEGDEKEE